MNLTDEQFTAWMKALRSGRYTQGKSRLICINSVFYASTTRENPSKRTTAYCCMGVLGDAVLHLPSNMLEGHGYLRFLDIYNVMPQEERPLMSREEVIFGALNDRHALTFPQIAAFIEGADPDSINWDLETEECVASQGK